MSNQDDDAADSKRKSKRPFSGVAKGFRSRTLVTGKLATKLGTKVAAQAAKTAINTKLGKSFGLNRYETTINETVEMAESAMDLDLSTDAGRAKAAKLAEKAIDSAWSMVDDMDQLKGLVMKFGQMASYLGSNVSPDVQKVLAKLQANASALHFSEVEPVITTELGNRPDALFDEFQEEAIAAASIGQVHKATYQGDMVAVKIQYPGVAEVIESDLKLIGAAGPLSFAFRKILGVSMNVEELIDELKVRVMEECDYAQEAVHLQKVHQLYQSDEEILIPKLYPSLSTNKVLTSEFMDGINFYDFRDQASQDEKNLAAKTLFRMSFESIFKHCYFNGDPHPGNYLFRDNGQVVFLDFGCVCKFEQEFIQNWKGMARAGIEDDKASFQKYCRALGFVGNEKKFDWEYHWELYNFLIRPVKRDEAFHYSRRYSHEGDDLMISQNKNSFAIKVPKPLLFANRLQWGLKNILVDLDATINTHDLFCELLYGDETPVF